jgi:hypothetical protein
MMERCQPVLARTGVGEEESIPDVLNMWDDAPVSRYHSAKLGGWVATPAEFKAAYKAEVSQTWPPGDGACGAGANWASMAC